MIDKPETNDSRTVVCEIAKTINFVEAGPERPPTHRNYYQCPYDGTSWTDEWSCACNDRCPACRSEIEPYFTKSMV
jgi:hypothetical protein